MELDRLWNWQKKKLACRIRPENGNPAGDSLREMFAELAGVDLNELLNEMKQSKKKKEQTDKVSVDFEAEKTFKDVLGRSRILGATKLALDKMEEYDKTKAQTVTQKNLKKVFTVLPKSPPKRVLMDLQRERSKPLRLPDQEEHKLATEKLEKKLAKQRAARMAAIEQSAKGEEGKKIMKDFASSLTRSQVLREYSGDLFGTGGPYLEGMMYLSRMADSTKRLNIAFGENEKMKKLEEAVIKQESEKNAEREANSELFESSTGEGGTNPDINAKLSCAVSLCNWSRNPANAARLASEGAVRAIMQLSMEPVMRITTYCAASFRFMSEQPALAVAMIEEGAITTISELVSANTDDFILYNLAIALVNLTRINGREGQVVEAAIVLALMNLVMIKPELGATCVRGLYNLTCVDVNYPSIERVIRALVSLSLSGTSNVKHLCAAALCNLSDLKSVRARMVEEGAINVLTALSRGAETRTRRICAVILQNLSAAKSVRVEMASRNSVAAAYGLSSDQDPIILRCIGLTLSRLSMEPTNCQRIIHEGGIAALCNIAVKYPTIPGITQPVASAFQLLSSNQPFRIQIVNEGSVTAIAALLRSSVDMFTLQHSLLALCNLLCESENHLSIIQQGLILTLVGMCSNENELLRDFCSLAFLNLSCAEDSRKHLVNGGAVGAIISIAKQDSAMTKKRCAATLCNLSYFAAGMSRMVQDGIIPCIVDLVLAKDIITVHYSCAALCRLCSTVENAKLILDSGAVPNLVQGAIDGDHVTKQFCGSVLSSLSFYEYCRIPLCDLGAIGALKGLAALNDDVTKQRCLVAFANLSCEFSVQLKMVEEGVVGIIAELANSYQEINYICCAKAICNLACFENTKSIVAKEGGVHALMMISMVQSVDRLTKLLCVLGLNNLLDDSTVDFMVSEGLVGSIANLSKIGDSHISNLCSKIFNHLSKYSLARAKMIERTSTLNALYKLCQPPSAGDGHHGHSGHRNSSASGSSNETQLVAIRTCCNLILDNSIRETVLKSGVLFTIEKSLEHSHDNDTITQILMALLSLCSNSNFMESIAKTNIPSILINLSLIADTKLDGKIPTPGKELPHSNSKKLNHPATTNITDKEFEIITKILAMLAYDTKSRLFLQKKEFFVLLFNLIKSKFSMASSSPASLSSIVWLILALRYLVLDYSDISELYSIEIKNTLLGVHESLQTKLRNDYNNDHTALSESDSLCYFRIYKSLVENIRSLSENTEEIDQLANASILQLLQRALDYFQEYRQYFTSPGTASTPNAQSAAASASAKSTSPSSQNVEEWTKYNVAVVIARFADASMSIRQNTATPDTCSILERLSYSPKCAELVAVALGMYLMDTKARIPFITPPIAAALVRLHGYPLVENAKSNLVLGIYGMSKVASCREFLLSPQLQMDRILVQFSGCESAKIKANVNRAYKNLHSDVNEAIEEGAVATLIAMSLEGKLKNQSSDDFNFPPIFPQSEQKLTPPEFAATDLLQIEDDRIPYRWYARIAVTKGGAAGKGPDPPEPPPMSTDGSAQYPNMMEELDGGEVEGKTRMAFAKMQIPSNLKDSYLLTDADFMIFDEREEISPNETMNVNEKDLMLETIEDPLNLSQQPQSSAPNTNDGDNNSVGSANKKVQKAGSRGRGLSRSSTAASFDNESNSATNSLKGNDSSMESDNKAAGKRRHKTVAAISSAGRDGNGGSRSPSPDKEARRSRKSNPPMPKPSNEVSISEKAAKLGLYN